MSKYGVILLFAVVATLAKGKYILVSNLRLISVPNDHLEFLKENELEQDRDSNLIGEAVEVKSPTMPAPKDIAALKVYVKVFEGAEKKLEPEPNAQPDTNNEIEQESPIKTDFNKPEGKQFIRKEITVETKIIVEYPESRILNVLHHSNYNPTADEQNPGTVEENLGDDQENPSADHDNPDAGKDNTESRIQKVLHHSNYNPTANEENPGTVEENLGNDQANPSADQDNPDAGKDNAGNRSESCPNSFVPINGRCYHFSRHQDKYWVDYMFECRSMKSDLLFIESKNEWDGIKDYLINHELEAKNWLIGAIRFLEYGWNWHGSSAPFAFTDWCSGEPNISGEFQCAHIARLGNHDKRLCWNVTQCIEGPSRFICKLKK